MAEMKTRLTGVPAILVLVVAVAAVIWRQSSMKASLDDEAASEINQWLVMRYAADALAKHVGHGGLDDASSLDRAALDEILASRQVEIVSIDARGQPDDIVVRVEVRVAGKEPPDGRSVRYFRMSHSLATGWHLRYETGAWSYRLKWF